MVYSIESEVLEPISEVDKFGVMVAFYAAQNRRYDIANRILDDLKAETPVVTTVDVEVVSQDDTTMLVQERSDAKTMLDNLTQSTQAELEQQEIIIAKGLDAWYEVGKAFETITKKKLFGVLGYKSFREYCKKRWVKESSHINRFIAAARVKDEICDYIEIAPGNMALYFELSKLHDLESKVAVWDELTNRLAGSSKSGKQPTILMLRTAVRKQLGQTPQPKTTTTIKVSVDAAELIKASAKQSGMSTEDLISKLLAKVLD